MPDTAAIIETDIPARLDRLPWTRFHTLVVVALGITWILDGLEVTLAGSIAGALQESPVLRFDAAEVGKVGTAYLIGAVIGAVLFGYLTDRLGRRKLFFVTLGLYLVATAATACSWDFWSFALFRFLTGAGIGGEYAAINSAIQEFVPARFRGRTDLAINGSFWIGAALGAARRCAVSAARQLAAGLGLARRFRDRRPARAGHPAAAPLPPGEPALADAPRQARARREAVIAEIESRVRDAADGDAGAGTGADSAHHISRTPLVRMVLAIVRDYPQRAVLGLVLMAAQAFFYNAIFFSYALVLTRFYAIPSAAIGWYILPFALGNFVGPAAAWATLRSDRPQADDRLDLCDLRCAAGHRRLSLSRRAARCCATDRLLDGDLLFRLGGGECGLSDRQRELPARSPGIRHRPLLRVGTAAGGVVSPWLFGVLVGSGERSAVFGGYLFGAVLMIAAALTELVIGVKAERQPLESVARPLSALAD